MKLHFTDLKKKEREIRTPPAVQAQNLFVLNNSTPKKYMEKMKVKVGDGNKEKEPGE